MTKPVDNLATAAAPEPVLTELSPMSLEQVRRMLGQLSYWHQPYFRLRLVMGLSHEEVLALRWGDVDLLHSTLRTGNPTRTVHLPPAVENWLPTDGAPDALVFVAEGECSVEELKTQLSLCQLLEQLPAWPLERLHENFPVLQLQAGETPERVAEQMGQPVELVRGRYGRYYRPEPFGIGVSRFLESHGR